MKPLSAFVALLVAILPSLASAAETNAPPGRLLFLGVAYDEEPDKRNTIDDFNYAPDNFVALFTAQSADLFREIKPVTLKGNAATRPAILEQLHALQRQAEKNDLVFLYWGTHGSTNGKGWGANLPDDTEMLGKDLKAELAKIPCPVVAVISTCGSGGFVTNRKQQPDLPPNVTAFCACRRKQSASNDLDVVLLEALAGFGDLDKNGQVTLTEVMAFVPQRHAAIMHESDEDNIKPVLVQAPGLAVDRPLAKVTGKHAAVVFEGYWYGATILEQGEENVKVRFLGYDSTSKNGPYAIPDKTVKLERVDFAGNFPPLEVKQRGDWHPATVVAPEGSGFKIHYVDYPKRRDEVVPLERIRYPFVPAQGETLSSAGASATKP